MQKFGCRFQCIFQQISGRYLNASARKACSHTHELTKQQHPRTWLCYSPSKHTVFCFACKLMNNSNVFWEQGYNDLQHTSNKIPCHEKSAWYLEAMIQLVQLSDAGCRVDAELVNQANAEQDCWRSVLETKVETIR